MSNLQRLAIAASLMWASAASGLISQAVAQDGTPPLPEALLDEDVPPLFDSPPRTTPEDRLDGRPLRFGADDESTVSPADDADDPIRFPLRTPFFLAGTPLPVSERLARAGRMHGDFFGGGNLLAFDSLVATTDLPLAGGSNRVKVADNNKALPQNRLVFMYHRFENALAADASQFNVGPDRQNFSVDQYTIGFEKTFLDGEASIEVRAPFTSRMEFYTPNFSVSGERAGNLTVIYKHLLTATPTFSSVAGVGLNLPTGSDASGHVNVSRYAVKNEATHVLPYAGLLWTPTDCHFFHAFVEGDIATDGNEIAVGVFGNIPDVADGVLNEQTLLHLDVSAGRWFYEGCDCDFVNGVAGLLELHYTTTLQDTDTVFVPGFATDFTFGNLANRQDILNLTAALHVELQGHTELKIGGVVPLRDDDDKLFDAEFSVFLNRRF